MRARAVVGRRITRVEHERFWNDHARRMESVVSRIVLDNGAVLYPIAYEGDYEPFADIRLVRPS